jgi:hypothetical protein
MKTNPEIVLSALMNGIEINGDNGMIFCMSEDDKFGIKMKNDEGEDCVMITDWSLNWFIKFCNELSELQIVQLTANLALNKINESK